MSFSLVYGMESELCGRNFNFNFTTIVKVHRPRLQCLHTQPRYAKKMLPGGVGGKIIESFPYLA